MHVSTNAGGKKQATKRTAARQMVPCTSAVNSAGKDTASAHLTDGALCAHELTNIYCPLNVNIRFNAPKQVQSLTSQGSPRQSPEDKLVKCHDATCSQPNFKPAEHRLQTQPSLCAWPELAQEGRPALAGPPVAHAHALKGGVPL